MTEMDPDSKISRGSFKFQLRSPYGEIDRIIESVFVPIMSVLKAASDIPPTAPITIDELLARDMHLVTYSCRHGRGPDAMVGVFIAGNVEELAMMAEGMTASGDDCQHIEHMLRRTPYFPWGVGEDLQAAIANALKRVNRYPRKQWFNYAYPEVWKAPLAYPHIEQSYVDWEPLPSMEVLIAVEKE
jgi:hypothetical protein